MSEISTNRQSFERYKPPSKEKTPTGKIRNIARRVANFVKRPERRTDPKQAFDLGEIIEAEKRISPERAKNIIEHSCAVRAIMSAAAHALGIEKITAERKEWDARFKQMKAPFLPDTDIHQELMDLYAAYSQNSTPLGNALKQVDINLHEKQTVRQIKKRIRRGEQVIIASTKTKPDHTLHVGLKGNRLISLSDEKVAAEGGESSYQEPELFSNKFTIISVASKQQNISFKNATRNDFALAA